MTGTGGESDAASVKRALELIDRVRRAAIVPTTDGTRWREVADDGRSCAIVFCRIADADAHRSRFRRGARGARAVATGPRGEPRAPSAVRELFYTALVHARIREAIARGCEMVTVDALPTSRPILVALGFREIGTKQEFRFGG